MDIAFHFHVAPFDQHRLLVTHVFEMVATIDRLREAAH